MEGTVNCANLEVFALDCVGAGTGESLVSGGTIFDAMTMVCFKFNSFSMGEGEILDFSVVLTAFFDFASIALTGFLFKPAFVTVDAATFAVLTIDFSTVLVAVLTANLETAFVTGLAIAFLTGVTNFVASDFEVFDFGLAFTGASSFLEAALTLALTAGLAGNLTGIFLTVFFATVFIHCLPAGLVFIQNTKILPKILSARGL